MRNHRPILVLVLFVPLIMATQTTAAGTSSSTQNGGLNITFSSLGGKNVFRYHELDGAATYDGTGYYAAGITYLFPLKPCLGLETGLEYAKHSIIVTPNLPPDMEVIKSEAGFSLINIPLTLQVTLGRHFFINGGVMLNLDTTIKSPITDQTGLGALLGLGLQYDFHPRLTVFANPYSKLYSMVPFTTNNYPQRVLESGFRFGIRVRLQD